MTVFNGETHIKAAIDSVFAQTMRDFELVVLDDGSTDNTATIVQSASDYRLKLIRHHRIGRARALNVALRECSARYVAILDADDISLPDRLMRQSDYLDNHSGVALIGSRYRPFIDERDVTTGCDILPQTFEEVVRSLKVGRHPCFHSSVMFRRDPIVALGGYDETLPCYEDMDLYRKVAAHHAIVNLDERLSLKRRHSKQFFASNGGVVFAPEGRAALATVMQRIAATLPN
jgi:glycosyltransferase involved in cell wall biosynthesis